VLYNDNIIYNASDVLYRRSAIGQLLLWDGDTAELLSNEKECLLQSRSPETRIDQMGAEPLLGPSGNGGLRARRSRAKGLVGSKAEVQAGTLPRFWPSSVGGSSDLKSHGAQALEKLPSSCYIFALSVA
jgi:hypothetical protein